MYKKSSRRFYKESLWGLLKVDIESTKVDIEIAKAEAVRKYIARISERKSVAT